MSTTTELSAQAEAIVNTLVHELGRFGTLRQWTEPVPPSPTSDQAPDVFVVSYPKSGTTLLQQLCYQLLVRTGRVPSDPTGRDHDDITDAVPSVEQRATFGRALPQHPSNPRLWKSHGTFTQLARVSLPVRAGTARVIYCVRDGRQAARSFLDFFMDWPLPHPVDDPDLRAAVYRLWFARIFLAPPNAGGTGGKHKQTTTAAQFVDAHQPTTTSTSPTPAAEPLQDKREVDPLPPWFAHVRSWLEAAKQAPAKDNILFLSYNSVVVDIPATVRRVASFLRIAVTNEDVAAVAQRCDRDAMASDPRFSSARVGAVMGWSDHGRAHVGSRARPANAPSLKHVSLPEEAETRFKDLMREAFGVETFEDLIQSVEHIV